MNRKPLDAIWSRPSNWSLVYRCPEDPRVIVPRRRRWMGWTINFAHPLAWVVLVASFLVAVGPALLAVWWRPWSATAVLVALAASIAVLVIVSHWEASRSRE